MSAFTLQKEKNGVTGSSINISRGLRASHLNRLRRQHQLTVAELAALSGISVATLNRWEKTAGVIQANRNSLSRIAKVFENPNLESAVKKILRRK